MIRSSFAFERWTVTPEIAAELLARNANNRPISQAHVFRLSESMRRGEWDFNGSPIRIACTGRLLDGQHRLSACVESGVSFDTAVVSGLPEECFSTIDQASRPRKISDVLSIEAGCSMKNASAAICALYKFKTFGQIAPSTSKLLAGFTTATARQLLLKHPGILDSVSVMNTSGPLLRNATGACLHYLFGLVDTDAARDFAEVMRDGSSDKRRPFNVFREGLIRISRSSASANHREAAARAIKSFNAEISGKTISVLTWRRNEDFPVILGLDYEAL